VSKGRDWSCDSRFAVYARDEGEFVSEGGAGAGRGAKNVSDSGGKKAPKV
jgi:hypothetical protein